ncbi:galactose-binding protein [Bergeyella porcorum]|uniref:galactose-binding protein n=1 Tax=Bergeyella porcorum TaxID=1735111 RepID=UPI0035E710B6
MKTVVYSINGKYFLDFGIYISESKGLLDKLKPKPRKSYSWAEQHGIVVDLSKPKYEEREISLKGWIIGESWHDMKAKFDLFLSEFDKEGLARLLIEFGKELVYDVYLADGVELDKEFRDGKMYGLFTIKLKEPNPVKKVLKLVGNDLRFSFTSPDWMDINIDGINESRKDSITINKTLQNRAVGGLDLGGRNLVLKSETPSLSAYEGSSIVNASNYTVAEWNTSKAMRVQVSGGTGFLKAVRALIVPENGTYCSVSFFVKNLSTSNLILHSNLGGRQETIAPNEAKRVVWESILGNGRGNIQIQVRSDNADFALWRIKAENGTRATDWTPAPEDVHYITIAGKIDEIVNLQTNAEIIWE